MPYPLGHRAYYKSVTTTSCFNYSPINFLAELNLVDVLYQMLRDKDPQVVSNCISVLNEVLANEGGIVLNSKIAHYLLNR